DPEQIDAELAAIESGAYVLKSRMDLTQLGNADNSTQLRFTFLSQKTALNIAKVQLEEAEFVVKRDEELMKPPNQLVTPAAHMVNVAKRNTLKSEVDDRTKLVEEWNHDFEYMAPLRTNIYAQMEKVIKADILRQQEQLRQMRKPIVLKAPISGRITAVLRHAGERVPTGAPLVTIASGRAERIVAYVRQPLNFRPKVGDLVAVRTRTTRRKLSD